MIYVDIGKKKFLIGMPWQEVVADDLDVKKDLEKKAKNLLKKGHNYGIISFTELQDIASLGEFNAPFNGLSFPKTYSLGYAMANHLKDGVFATKFSLKDLSENIAKNARLPIPTFIEGLEYNESFYWACAFQGGVIVSSGEITGSLEDIKNFVIDQSSFLNDSTIYLGCDIPDIENSTSSSIIKKINIEEITSECKKDCQIKQLNGFPKNLFLIGIVFLVLGGYVANQHYQESKALALKAKQEMMRVAQLNKKTPEQLRLEKIEKAKVAYLKNFETMKLNQKESIQFSGAKKVIQNALMKTTYGWHLDSVNCSASTEKCHIQFSKQNPSASIKSFLSSQGKKSSDIAFSGDGKTIAYVEPIIIDKSSFESTYDNAKAFFNSLPNDMNHSIGLISKSQIKESIMPSFSWKLMQDKVLANAEKTVFSDIQKPVYQMALTIKSNDFYTMQSIYNYYSSDNLSIEQIEVKNTNDNDIAWALKYSYKTLIKGSKK